MKRIGSAVWLGGLRDGKGTFATNSGVLRDVPYSVRTRFEDAPGTNPEELVAAAHAGCFSMALSGELGKAGLHPERIETTATLNFEKLEAGWTATSIHLTVTAKVPKADRPTLEKAAQAARTGCPVSRLLKATITMEVRLL